MNLNTYLITNPKMNRIKALATSIKNTAQNNKVAMVYFGVGNLEFATLTCDDIIKLRRQYNRGKDGTAYRGSDNVSDTVDCYSSKLSSNIGFNFVSSVVWPIIVPCIIYDKTIKLITKITIVK